MSECLIDTHCHLHDLEFFTPAQAKEFLRNAEQAGVRQIICIGTNPEDSQVACDFANQHENVFWTWGIHPEYASMNRLYPPKEAKGASTRTAKNDGPVRTGAGTGLLSRDNLKRDKRLVAIGEIGLDYHYDGYNRDAQIHLFEQMLQLARDTKLPVSLHIREAFADAWSVLDNFPEVTGVVHSFTGSKKDLREALNRGFYIGVNGLVTYTTPPLPPLEKIVLETDAPFLTPVPFRGTINQSAYVREIAAYLANKLGVAEVNIAEQTTKNARQLFQFGAINPQ